MKQEIKRLGVAIENMDRRMGVMLEHMDAKFDLLVEGFGVLDRKIDSFRDDFNERFRDVDYKFEVAFDELHAIRTDSNERITLLDKRMMKFEGAE